MADYLKLRICLINGKIDILGLIYSIGMRNPSLNECSRKHNRVWNTPTQKSVRLVCNYLNEEKRF